MKVFPLTTQWWGEFEVSSGMAVRVGEMPSLRESSIMQGHADSAAMACFYACWKVAVAYM